MKATGKIEEGKHFTDEEALAGEFLDTAPDIIIDPHDGYDFKAGLEKNAVFETGPISGMHTYHDAIFYLRGADSLSQRPVIYDAPATILNLLGIEIPPPDFDGVSLLEEVRPR